MYKVDIRICPAGNSGIDADKCYLDFEITSHDDVLAGIIHVFQVFNNREFKGPMRKICTSSSLLREIKFSSGLSLRLRIPYPVEMTFVIPQYMWEVTLPNESKYRV
jgi:hypothetical protein